MSDFCCGASKIGTVTSINQDDIWVHHVPSLYCPVCKNVEVHPNIKENVDIIIDIALRDDLREIDLNSYMNTIDQKDLFEQCATVDHGNKKEVAESQIDISLDLLTFARTIGDTKWEDVLKNRLSVLSKQKDMTKNR